MLTLLADAMFTATLKQRDNTFPLHKQNHGETYIPRRERPIVRPPSINDPSRYLW